jgi:hypothetical protein
VWDSTGRQRGVPIPGRADRQMEGDQRRSVRRPLINYARPLPDPVSLTGGRCWSRVSTHSTGAQTCCQVFDIAAYRSRHTDPIWSKGMGAGAFSGAARGWSVMTPIVCGDGADQIRFSRCGCTAARHSNELLPRRHLTHFHIGTIEHHSAEAPLLLEMPSPAATTRP